MKSRGLFTVGFVLCSVVGAYAQSGETSSRVVEAAAIEVTAPSLHLGMKFNILASRFTKKITRFIITEVEPGSIADRAGLRVGDRVVSWNGIKIIGEKEEALERLTTKSVNSSLSMVLEIERRPGRKKMTLNLVLKDFSGTTAIHRKKPVSQQQVPVDGKPK